MEKFALKIMYTCSVANRRQGNECRRYEISVVPYGICISNLTKQISPF